MVSIRKIFMCAALLVSPASVLASDQCRIQVAAAVKPPVELIKPAAAVRPAAGILILKPDLVVSLSSDSKATAGMNIPVTVKVTNKGTVKAIGTSEGPADKAYMVDLVWSSDSNIPASTAVQPVYQGLTKDDFVEDMLVQGGRISNTTSIPPGGSVTYNLTAYAPNKIQPGTYWLGAYVDSLGHVAESKENNNTTSAKVLVGAPLGSTNTVPAGVDYWVMPWAVGGTPLYNIKSTGLTDYTDGLSGMAMKDAPFGGRLGFRHGYDSRIPTPQLYYYRWQYRPSSGGAWQEFSESIGAHYVRKVGMAVSFPVYPLGPKNVGGKNLYEFRPHDAPPEAGAVTTWPATDWFGDIYSGLLNSSSLPEGTYQFKLEIYSQSGVQVLPSPATFQFIAATGTAADGTVNTVPAPVSAIEDGGYLFTLHLDNRSCRAVIDAPILGGGSATDACGFLLYDPAIAPTAAAAKIRLAFHATHPANFALFSYDVIRATTNVIDLAGEVSAAAAGVFTGDGSGNFIGSLTRTQLLGGCSLPAGKGKGAFAEVLHVLPKATTGWNQRITAYDAYAVRAFALAPK